MAVTELTILLCITALVSLLVVKARQPIIIGYIAAGILLGPQFLGWLESTHQLQTLSQMGIVLLLFIVGLHLNPQVLKEVGRAALLTGIGQVIFTSAIGFFLTLATGYNVISSLFIAIAITFSSTIIIMKLISDRRDIKKTLRQTLHWFSFGPKPDSRPHPSTHAPSSSNCQYKPHISFWYYRAIHHHRHAYWLVCSSLPLHTKPRLF